MSQIYSFIKQSRMAFLWIVLLLPIARTALSAESSNPDRDHPVTILVLGDSLSAAYNIPQQDGWVNLLQKSLSHKYPNIVIRNASISGETTKGGLSRLPKQLDSIKPNIVIIELGGNDGLRGFDLAYTKKNLGKMIKLSRAVGAKVVLCQMRIPPNYGRSYTQAFEQIYKDLSSEFSITLTPFILKDVALKPELMQQDGIHPTKEGQPLIAELMRAQIEPIIKQAIESNKSE